jgi:regulator of ribonuclease activity A
MAFLMVCDAYLPLRIKNNVSNTHWTLENLFDQHKGDHTMQATSSLKFATCDLCDAHKNDASGDFRVLAPAFKNFGGQQKFFGPVVTVKCFEDNSLVKAEVESDGQGRVLVVDGGASLRRALVGGNLAADAAKNGWAGLVIDGCVRDLAELADCLIGICALAVIPLPTEKFGAGQRDVAIQIQGTWVRPGDWLYADVDGIVVMPAPSLT